MAFLLPVIFEVAECLFGAATVAAEGAAVAGEATAVAAEAAAVASEGAPAIGEGAAIGAETTTATETLETESLASNYLESNVSRLSTGDGLGLGFSRAPSEGLSSLTSSASRGSSLGVPGEPIDVRQLLDYIYNIGE